VKGSICTMAHQQLALHLLLVVVAASSVYPTRRAVSQRSAAAPVWRPLVKMRAATGEGVVPFQAARRRLGRTSPIEQPRRRAGAILKARAASENVLQVALSKAFGYSLMTGSFMLEVPQIVKIWAAKSAKGISAASRYWAVPMYSSSVVYHILEKYPFSCYGENLVILLQNFAIVGLLWYYNRTPVKEVAGVTGAFVAMTALQFQLPPGLRPALIYANIPCMLGAYVPQIVENHRAGNTGQLAILPAALKCVGCAMRVFTTLTQIGMDIALLANFILSLVLNAILVFQGWVMRENTARANAAAAVGPA